MSSGLSFRWHSWDSVCRMILASLALAVSKAIVLCKMTLLR